MVQEVVIPIREIEVVEGILGAIVVVKMVEAIKMEGVETNRSVVILHNICGHMEHVRIRDGLATTLNLDMYSGQPWKTSVTVQPIIVHVLDSLGAILQIITLVIKILF